MPGKRKRTAVSTPVMQPLSAIAAAKLRAQLPEPAKPTLEVPPSPSITSVGPDEESLPVHTNQQLCTWRYDYDNVLSQSDEQLTISLGKNKTVALIGCYDFIVLKGAVTISGANFGAGPRKSKSSQRHRVYAPSTHPIPSIRGLDNENEIQFKSCECPTPFANLSPLFANIWNARPEGGSATSFALITESGADPLKRPLSPETIPNDWTRQMEECASSTSAAVITGSSFSGKSSFAKRLINRYLTGLGKAAQAIPSVYYLDLDASAPEYTPHGQVSLVLVREVNLGPSFTHSSTISAVSERNDIIRAHPLRLKTLELDHDYFISCVEDLLRTYLRLQQHTTDIPLIINTPSWIYTTDFDLLRRMLPQIKPRYLIHLTDLQAIDEESSVKLDGLDVLSRKAGLSIAHISAQTNSISPCRVASELRNMQMLSYFHCAGSLNSSFPKQLAYSPAPLSHTTPWEFCYDETSTYQQAFLGFLNIGEHIEPSQFFATLNGALIQIVETEDENIHQQFNRLPRTNKYRIPYLEESQSGRVEPLDPRTSRVICTALLRNWVPEERVAQVLIPETHEKLLHALEPSKTVFVFGCCEQPEWAYTEDSYHALAQQRSRQRPGDKPAIDRVELPPWVATAKSMEHMGYLNIPRRTRKFQQ